MKALPQKSHLCGFRGTWTRMWEVMWSRLTVVVRQLDHPQVRLRLLVLLRPTWRSHTCSYAQLAIPSQHMRERERERRIEGEAYVESLWSRAEFLAALPLTFERAGRVGAAGSDLLDSRGRDGGGSSSGMLETRLDRDALHCLRGRLLLLSLLALLALLLRLLLLRWLLLERWRGLHLASRLLCLCLRLL